jgi:hypothetical protein
MPAKLSHYGKRQKLLTIEQVDEIVRENCK